MKGIVEKGEKVINILVFTLLVFRQFCHAYTPIGYVEAFVKQNGILDRTVEGGEAQIKRRKLLMTGRNQEKTPHVGNSRRCPFRSNNSIELSMIVFVVASTIPGISMNPIIAIAQDTLF